MFFRPIEVLNVEFVQSRFWFVKVNMLYWFQGHIQAHIHVNIELPTAFSTFFVVITYFCVTRAYHMEIQIVGIPPPQRKVQLSNICLMLTQSVLQLLFDYYLVVGWCTRCRTSGCVLSYTPWNASYGLSYSPSHCPSRCSCMASGLSCFRNLLRKKCLGNFFLFFRLNLWCYSSSYYSHSTICPCNIVSALLNGPLDGGRPSYFWFST